MQIDAESHDRTAFLKTGLRGDGDTPAIASSGQLPRIYSLLNSLVIVLAGMKKIRAEIGFLIDAPFSETDLDFN
jgi:hypothetical protein